MTRWKSRSQVEMCGQLEPIPQQVRQRHYDRRCGSALQRPRSDRVAFRVDPTRRDFDLVVRLLQCLTQEHPDGHRRLESAPRGHADEYLATGVIDRPDRCHLEPGVPFTPAPGGGGSDCCATARTGAVTIARMTRVIFRMNLSEGSGSLRMAARAAERSGQLVERVQRHLHDRVAFTECDSHG
jgi:hypothetical protein